MPYRIIGSNPNRPKDRWVHSQGYFSKEKAQSRIDSGDVYKYLMSDLKSDTFAVEEY